jgi:protein SCO1/2
LTIHTSRRGLLALAGLTVLLAGCRVEAPERTEAEERAQRTGFRGILLEDGRPRPDFTLADPAGEPVRFLDLAEDRLVLLFFGYTYCPDICPVHMASLAAVKSDLPVADQRRMAVVFVTVDPRRDTPDRIRTWLDNFDRDFVGLRGTEAAVDSIMLAMGLPPGVRDTAAGPDYPVGHASQVIAYPPGVSYRVVYPFGTRQADWVHDLPKLLNP